MPTDHIEALRALRARYVELRRKAVHDSLQFDLPPGNQQRLADIQNAITAVDAAIRDEEALVSSVAFRATGPEAGARSVEDDGEAAPTQPSSDGSRDALH